MINHIRSEFPALSRKYHGNPLVYLDGPAGTQVPQSVIDATAQYYSNSNANSHGHFLTSKETDVIMENCRSAVATLLGADSPETISFGQNMTTLNYSLSHAIGRYLNPGDEILITQLDHEANRGPWLGLEAYGMKVKEVRLMQDGKLDYADLENKLNSRTKLLAIGYASNIFGTVNDLKLARALTSRVGAWLLVDAVHAAPHMAIDVREIDCEFLLCSAYKFYGPHVGLLYSKPGLLDQLNTDRLRTQSQQAPYKIETGTLNHAAIAGVESSIRFIASLGTGPTLRKQVLTAFKRISKHEMEIAENLYHGLESMPGFTVFGPSFQEINRAPTLAFTVEGHTPDNICKKLGENGICAWDGHFYAIRATEVLDLVEKGGVTRMGVVAYNTQEEINRTLDTLKTIVR